MSKWEYLVLSCPLSFWPMSEYAKKRRERPIPMAIDKKATTDLLNKCGIDGWELVSASNANMGEAVSVNLFLKRPLEE